MKFGIYFLPLLLCVSAVASDNLRLQPLPSLNLDDLTMEIAALKAKIANLTQSINDHGGPIEKEWAQTNIHLSSALNVANSVELEWRKTNSKFEEAVTIVNERYTVGTLVGIGIAVGLAPALVNALCLPIIYLVAKRGAMAGAQPAT